MAMEGLDYTHPSVKGDQGIPGPNVVSILTASDIVGVLKGAAGKVAQATPGTDFETAGAAAAVRDAAQRYAFLLSA